MECKKEQNLKDCTCTYTPCDKIGVCYECVKFHREKNEIPGCFFSKDAEAKYDRSVEAFIESKK